MSEVRVSRSPRARADAASTNPRTAEDYIYPMPTVAEVIAAGYPATYWDSVKKERDEFIAKFNSDPVFKIKAIAQHARAEAERNNRRR